MFWNVFCSRTIMFTKEPLLILLRIRVLGSVLWSNMPSSPPTPHPHPNQPPSLLYIWGNSDSERPGDCSKISQARAEMLGFQHLYHLAQRTFHNIPLCQMIKLDSNLGFQRQAGIFLHTLASWRMFIRRWLTIVQTWKIISITMGLII